MTFAEFESEMRRLVGQFGRQTYGEERVALFFEAVRDLSPGWWKRTVDKFLGECRYPPLMTELRTEVAIERERVWAVTKSLERRDAETFMRRFGTGDLQTICETIKRRIAGELSDQDFDAFQSAIEGAVRTMEGQN